MGIFDRITRKATPAKSSPAAVANTTTEKTVVIPTTVLVQPLVTEKSSATGAYYFEVASTTNKQEVAKAFKTVYGKVPRRVNIINMRGKVVRRGRIISQQSNWKKAIVYLNKGESVNLFN